MRLRTSEGGVEASDVDEEADLAIVHRKLGVGDEFAADILGRLEAREDRFEKELVKVDVDRGSRGGFLRAASRFVSDSVRSESEPERQTRRVDGGGEAE